MKNLVVLIFESFFFDLASLREAKQSISHNISFSPTIINSKIVLQELLSLADLIKTQVFYIHELIKIIIVIQDKKLIFVVF